jgi:hypothetical protein
LPKRVFASFCPDLLLQDKALTFGNEVSAFFVPSDSIPILNKHVKQLIQGHVRL